MVAVCDRIRAKKRVESLESSVDDVPRRIVVADVVQTDLKSLFLESENKIKIVPIFQCRAVDASGGRVGQRPNGLRRANTQFGQQSINRLDVFNRTTIGLIEHA